jgi:predicted dehydrogenase
VVYTSFLKRKEGIQNIRFAIIRAGKFAEKRANVIKTIPSEKAELKAIVDTDLEKAKTLAIKFGCEAFSDYRKLLITHLFPPLLTN